MRACGACGESVSASFRYCPWCSAPLRLKLVDFFRAHPSVEPNPDRALRVSRYLGGGDEERHVRFSVWNEDGRAESAISLAEDEVGRLARFLLGHPAGRYGGSLVAVVRQWRM